jgi:Domain of Unknown Function (DUF1080)/DinB superfamily
MRKLMLSIAAAVPLLAADPVPLFNGKDLSGWTMVGPGRFVVEDGLMKTEGGMGLLYYNGQKIGNQTLRVVFKTAGTRDNSGVVIRMPEAPPDAWYGVHNGYEVQIQAGGDEWHSTGSLYSLAKVKQGAQKPAGEWNTMDIQLDGQTTRVTLNGEQVNEFKGGQDVPPRKQWYEPVRGPRPDSGYIGLQNHDARSVVYFKEISVIGGTVVPVKEGAPLTQNERDRLLSYYHSTRKQILDAVAGLSDAQWKFKPADNKWSIRDVVEHLTLSEEGIFGFATVGLKKSAEKPETKLADEKFVAMITDRSKPAQAPEPLRPSGKWPTTQAMVDEFRARRDKNLEWIRETAEPLRSTYTKMPMGVVDTYQALLLIPAHTERHLAQIDEVKASSGFPK